MELPCESCQALAFDRIYSGEKGRRIQWASEIATGLQAGFRIDWDEIPADIYLATQIYISERNRFDLDRKAAVAPPSQT